MATVQKFLFDTSFDEPGTDLVSKVAAAPLRDRTHDQPAVAVASEAEPYAGLDRRRRASDAPPPEPPPDLYTAAQLDAAREEGFLKGHASALEEEGASTARLTAKALKGIAAGLDHLDDQQQVFNAGVEKTAIRLALAMVRRMLPATAETGAVPEIQRLLSDTLQDVLDQPRLVIRVHGSLAETIRKSVGPLREDHAYEGRITVRPDNDLPIGDCRLEWGDGGIERDSVRLWADIEAAVARHLEEAVPPPPNDAAGAMAVAEAEAEAGEMAMAMECVASPPSDPQHAPENAPENAPVDAISLDSARHADPDLTPGTEQGEHHG